MAARPGGAICRRAVERDVRPAVRALHPAGAAAVHRLRGCRARGRCAVAGDATKTFRAFQFSWRFAPACVLSRPSDCVRHIARVQRLHVSAAIRLLHSLPRAAHSGAHGRVHRIFVGGARGLRRDTHRGSTAVADSAACRVRRRGTADAGRVRAEAARFCHDPDGPVRDLRGHRARPRRRPDRGDVRVSDVGGRRSDVSCTTRRFTGRIW